MKKIFCNLVLLVILQLTYCTESASQQKKINKHIGGNCEGCEAIYENTIPFKDLDHVDTLPGFGSAGEKIMISGVVYKKDGKTPAKDVILYVYHTDQTGVYPTKGDEKGWGRRHGYIRGWMKTNEKGEYKFYTFRPASYPNSSNPQHIHITLKEPDKNEYWIDDFHFLDDPLVTERMKNNDRKRGGSGFLQLQKGNGIKTATRNIILGMNVEDYPE